MKLEDLMHPLIPTMACYLVRKGARYQPHETVQPQTRAFRRWMAFLEIFTIKSNLYKRSACHPDAKI